MNNDSKEILNLIQTIWATYPSLRFHQLLSFLIEGYSNKNNGLGKVVEEDDNGMIAKTAYDLFHVGDKEFLEFLRQCVKNNSCN